MAGYVLVSLLRMRKKAEAEEATNMQPNEDPRKRPLLSAEQLRKMRREPERPLRAVDPREAFERLFRPTTEWHTLDS